MGLRSGTWRPKQERFEAVAAMHESGEGELGARGDLRCSRASLAGVAEEARTERSPGPWAVEVVGGRGRRQQVDLLLEDGDARGGASARELRGDGSTCSGTRGCGSCCCLPASGAGHRQGFGGDEVDAAAMATFL